MEMKTHQIVLRTARPGMRTTVSCQCRASYEKYSRQKGGGEYYEPMEQVPGETVWDTYNKSDNHWVEFGPEDRIRT